MLTLSSWEFIVLYLLFLQDVHVRRLKEIIGENQMSIEDKLKVLVGKHKVVPRSSRKWQI